MNKRDLATLAIIGVTAVTSGCQRAKAQTGRSEAHPSQRPEMTQKKPYTSADKDAFYNKLSSAGKTKFNEMDSSHQKMAMDMAEQSCSGKNECAGMGGCKSAHNSCAGKNSCRGQGGPPMHDSNKAVVIQHMKQNGTR